MKVIAHLEKAREMAQRLDLSESGIQRRKDFLGITHEEEVSVRDLAPFLRERVPEFVQVLHEQINSFPESRAILEKTHSQAWLKARHAEYFVEMVSGPYDQDYVHNRLSVGIIHQLIGLGPEWVQSSFALFLKWANGLLRTDQASPCSRNPALPDILSRILFFDLGLVMDSYFLAERERMEELSRVFETNVEAVWILDGQWTILHANQTSEKVIGWNPEELAGRSLGEFLGSDQDCPAPSLPEIGKTAREDGHWEESLFLRHKNGKIFPSWATVNVFWRPGTNDAEYILEFRDRTEEQKTQNELIQKTKDLLRSNRDLEQFAYVASHDLQEPLRMVTSYTQLLARRYQGKLSDEADEFIHYAVDGALRMQSLINALLSYSRVDSMGRELVPCESRTILQNAMANLKMALSECGGRVEAEDLPVVLGDPVQLMQLFQNLVSNALKFRAPDRIPVVRISARREGDFWLFSVQDNGIGIDPRFYERIFVIFQRLHTKEEYPGTGIGLAMCKRIVERHGGTIRVDSHPGEGSIFYFTLRHL